MGSGSWSGDMKNNSSQLIGKDEGRFSVWEKIKDKVLLYHLGNGAWLVWVSNRCWAVSIHVLRPLGAAEGGKSAQWKPGFGSKSRGIEKK